MLLKSKDIRGSVCYDFNDHTELVIAHDGRWFLCQRTWRVDEYDVIKDVTCCLDSLKRQDRVHLAGQYGQIDNHVKTKESRAEFLGCIEELRAEAFWEERKRNFGNVDDYVSLIKKYEPIADAVWTKEWFEGLEIMQTVLARLEP